MPKNTAPTVERRRAATNQGTIGARLKLLRERRNLDQVDVAVAVGVSRPTVSEWESDKKAPSRENARRLAVYFKTDIRWLLEGGAEPIVAQNPEEEAMLKALRDAPDNIRNAVAALLYPYGDPSHRRS
jgi:transcriptional regulator with XRE-family HTH domain